MIFTRDFNARWKNMRIGIETQAEFLSNSIYPIYDDVCKKLDGFLPPSHLYFVGCGDSYFAGLAARYAVEKWTQRPTEALEALEFSRYAIETAPQDSLVVAVSNSGEVSRTVECLYFAREKGLRTIGVTNNPHSRLAQAADINITYQAPKLPPPPAVGWGPGTVSYIASLIVLYIIGLRIGELTAVLKNDEIKNTLDDLESMSSNTLETIKLCEPAAIKLGKLISLKNEIVFIGGGPNYGTAQFAKEKWIEASRSNAIGQGLEEWAHENFFACRNGTYTVVFAPPGASNDRAREQLAAISEVGGYPISVCDNNDSSTSSLGKTTFPIQGSSNELLSPILYCIPASLLAYHFCINNPEVLENFRDDELRYNIIPRLIRKSNIPNH